MGEKGKQDKEEKIDKRLLSPPSEQVLYNLANLTFSLVLQFKKILLPISDPLLIIKLQKKSHHSMLISKSL